VSPDLLWACSRAGICKRPDTGAQVKPISEVVKDFEQSLGNPSAFTRRVYMADAKAALRAACLELWQNPSTDELLALIREFPSEKRISPFLAFLGDGGPNNSLSDQDSAALQNWVIQKLAKQMRLVKNPSIATRRDLGLIAALCAAPARGTPRKWPENCLKIEGGEVLLWDVAIEEPCFAVSLRFWHTWREPRTGRSRSTPGSRARPGRKRPPAPSISPTLVLETPPLRRYPMTTSEHGLMG
jgi:hypothetical protein